uniref:Dynein heavy chain 11, axonemal n=1 Tax=Sphaerodactylus townsendi TaxID=933632 RepID=A0ACB8FVC2_9SAUR
MATEWLELPDWCMGGFSGRFSWSSTFNIIHQPKKVKRPQADAFDQECQHLKQQLRALYSWQRANNEPSIPDTYFSIKKRLSQRLKDIKMSIINAEWEKLIQATNSNDTRSFWKIVSSSSRINNNLSAGIPIEAWYQHYKNTFSAEEYGLTTQVLPSPDIPMDWPTVTPTEVREAKANEVNIDEARELYRPAAARASLLYFVVHDLSKINPIYQFSLKAFNTVFHKAVERAEASADIQERISNLKESITYFTFLYVGQGLFEKDKLIFLIQTTVQILLRNKEIELTELNFLLRFTVEHTYKSPVDFLTTQSWSAIRAIALMDEFRGLDRDIEGSAKRWKKWVDSECSEKEKLPQEWKSKSSFKKLIILRALRPDRMTYALRNFVEEKLGPKYVAETRIDLAKSYEESSPATAIFFILSPGVDPLKDLETLGQKLGVTIDSGKFHNISLGQGQEIVAEEALKKAAKYGHWVILQNIHLVVKWLGTLEKLLEEYGKQSHEDYRVFISAEPAPTPEEHIIPQGILENSIKIINEPPTGMLTNLHAALYNFDQEVLELCSREQEFKSIFFSLCYFHTCVAGRRKFGPQGWNRRYPFNMGDLTICVNVLYNYLEANSKFTGITVAISLAAAFYETQGEALHDDWQE